MLKAYPPIFLCLSLLSFLLMRFLTHFQRILPFFFHFLGLFPMEILPFFSFRN